MEPERLYDAYNRYFEAVRADTPELLEEVFRLRYQVYCVEHKFEKADDFPDELERDAYDSRSTHTLLIHRPTDTIAGSVRLVLPDHEHPAGSLPIDDACKDSILQDSNQIPRENTAEVSRFAIARTFRRRHGEHKSPSGVTEESLKAQDAAAASGDRRVTHHLTLGLISSLVEMSAEHGVSIWCSVMERALLRLLTRIGIHFTNIGSVIDYHGKRQPCYSPLGALLERVKEERPDVWEVLTDEGRFIQPGFVDSHRTAQYADSA